MLSGTKQAPEEKKALKDIRKRDLTIKTVSYDLAKQLDDAVCIKYKKAFEML